MSASQRFWQRRGAAVGLLVAGCMAAGGFIQWAQAQQAAGRIGRLDTSDQIRVANFNRMMQEEAKAPSTARLNAQRWGDVPFAPPVVVDYRQFDQTPPAPQPVARLSGDPAGQLCDFDIQCSDCNVCTFDTCSEGVCSDGPRAGFGCSDDGDCEGTCDGGLCTGLPCVDDTDCCGDPSADPPVDNGTCVPFTCDKTFGGTVTPDGKTRCVNGPIPDGTFEPGSECDDGLICNGLETCDSGAGLCVPGGPLGGPASICDNDSPPADQGKQCESDEECNGGTCATNVCSDDGVACTPDPLQCEGAPDAACGERPGARCVRVTLPCDDLGEVCDEQAASCKAPCTADSQCDDDGLACTKDVCCTAGSSEPECSLVAEGTCVRGINPCGPGGTCNEPTPPTGNFTCGDGRCCDNDGTCTVAKFDACQGENERWLATTDACSTFGTTEVPNECPIYSSGLAPRDFPLGATVGPISFFTPCPDNLRRFGDDYSVPTGSGFINIVAVRWIASVQFPSRMMVENFDAAGRFNRRIIFPIVGGSNPISGPIVRTVLFEPALPASADGFFAFSDDPTFTNKLGTLSVFAASDPPEVGFNDATKIFYDNTGDDVPDIVTGGVLGICDGGNREGMWCVIGGVPGCPAGTCTDIPDLLAFEILGEERADAPVGGCCEASAGSCSLTTRPECFDAGGVFRGEGVGCAVCLGGDNNGAACGPGTGCVTCQDAGCNPTDTTGNAVCTEQVCAVETDPVTGSQKPCVDDADCDAGFNFCSESEGPCTDDADCPEAGETCVINNCIAIAQCQVQAVCDTSTGTCSVEACPPEDPDGFGCGSSCDPNCCTVPFGAISKSLCNGGGKDGQLCQVEADCPGGTCDAVQTTCGAPGSTVRTPTACDPAAPAGAQGCPAGEFCDGVALAGGDNCTEAAVPVLEVPPSSSPNVVVTVTQTGNNFLASHDDALEGVCDGGDNAGFNCDPLAPLAQQQSDCPNSTAASPCQFKGGSVAGLADPDGTNDPLWWSGIQVTFPNKTAIGDNCAWMRHDFCCTEPVHRPAWAGMWTGCPPGPTIPLQGAPPPIGIGRRDPEGLGRGSGFCNEGDDNVVSSFGPIGPGTYYKPVLSFPGSTFQPPITGGDGGVFQTHFSVAACPEAACCATLCSGGTRDGRPCNPNGLEDCPGPGAQCIGGFCVGGIFEGLPCDDVNGVDQCPGGTCGDAGCFVTNELECLTAGGFFNAQPFLPQGLGNVVTCGTDPTCAEGAGSDNPCCIGTCCLGPGECLDESALGDRMTKAECDTEEGEFIGGPAACESFCSITRGSCEVDGECPQEGERCNVIDAPPCPICRLTGARNCQEGTVTFGFLADRSRGNILADDFVAEGDLLTELCWNNFFGTSAANDVGDDCEADTTWSIRVFDEDRGMPGNIIFESGELSRDDPESGLVGAPNGDFQFGDHREWSWSVRLANPVPLVADDRYWIEISGLGSSGGECFIWVVNTTQDGNFFSLLDSFQGSGTPEGNFWTIEDRIGFDNDWEFCVLTGNAGQGAKFDEPMPPGACCQCDGVCTEVETFEECLIQNNTSDGNKPGPDFEGKFTFGDGLNDCQDAACEAVGGGGCPGEGGTPGENCADAIVLNDPVRTVSLGQCRGGKRDKLFCDPLNGDADCAGPPAGTCVPIVGDPDEEGVQVASFFYDNRCSSTDGRSRYPAPPTGPGGDNPNAIFVDDVWFVYHSTCEVQGRLLFNTCNDFVPGVYEPMFIFFTDGTAECPPCSPRPPLSTARPFVDDVCHNDENTDRDAPITPGVPTAEFFATVPNQCFLIRVGGDASLDTEALAGTKGAARIEITCVPQDCTVGERAIAETIKSAGGQQIVSTKNRFLSVSTGDSSSLNRGRLHAIKVTITNMPAGFTDLIGRVLWAGETSFLGSTPGRGLADSVEAADTRFLRVSGLQCDPLFQDWTNLHSCRGGGAGVNATNCDPADGGACGGNPALCQRDAVIHMHHPLIVPGAEYRVEVLDDSCDPCSAASFDPSPLVLPGSKFGDVAGSFLGSPDNLWSGPDGTASVANDVLSVLDAFLGKPVAPIKSRAEGAGFGVQPVDGRITVGDALIYIDAALGKPFGNSLMAPVDPPAACPDPCARGTTGG